jgi:hypothetical protein
MHTSSGAAYGRDDDGGDAPVSSCLENKENHVDCQPRFSANLYVPLVAAEVA